MDLNGVPVPTIDWSSTNLAETWRKFEEHTDLIFQGPLKEKEESVRITYLLLWIGEKGRDIFNTLTLTNEEKKKLDVICKKIKEHLQPKVNPVFSRYKFNNEIQGENTIEQFITRLRILARDCNYTNADEKIRDRIVFGVKSQKIREKLINEGDKLTLDKAIQICQSFEYTQEQLRTMCQATTAAAAVHDVRAKPTRTATYTGQRKPVTGPRSGKHTHDDSSQRGATSRHANRTSKPFKDSAQTSRQKCQNCGNVHDKGRCPAFGKQCFHCKKWNHFGTMCRSKKVNEIESSDNCQSDIFIDSVESEVVNGQVFAEIQIGPTNYNVKFKVDTGAQVNILPLTVFQNLGFKSPLEKSKSRLSAYNGNTLDLRGCITVECKHISTGHTGNVVFHVVDTKSHPLFACQSSIDFGLVQLTYSVQSETQNTYLTNSSVLRDYATVFEGIGNFPGECNIRLDTKAVSVVHPPRKIPIALHNKLKDELSRMESLGVITKVNTPTDWVNSMVVAEKSSGKLRICIDARDLNSHIRRPHYPMRTIDDVLPNLTGAQYFTKLDARSGYWAIKLSEKSSYLTTFNTIFGRYRYLRLPFGLKCSGDEFIRKVDECFEGLNGVVAIVDDILVCL